VQTKGIKTKIVAENFPNLEKEIAIQVQEAFRTPNRQDQKRTSPQHIIVKTLGTQNKERILKAAREKHQVTLKNKLIRIRADFSTKTLKARRTWNNVFQALKENDC
jgi:hypothetical protein